MCCTPTIRLLIVLTLPPCCRCPLNRGAAPRLVLPRSRLERSDFVRWHKREVPTPSSNVRVYGHSGKHILVLSSSHFDPHQKSRLPMSRSTVVSQALRQPGVPGQSIKNLSPQWITFRDTRVVKILCAIMRHPKLRHHASRSIVSDARMRHNLREANPFEAKLKCCSRRFHGESLFPKRPC